jgi:hypothetical protein
MYNEIKNANKILHLITVGDVQMEAQEKLNRLLNDDEIDYVANILEYGIGESSNVMYNAAFEKMA